MSHGTVGTALATIRDQRLYRETHADFDTYCRERWGFSRQRGEQMIQAASVAKDATIVALPPPSNEGQARELTRISAEHRADAWTAAVRNHGDNVTARDVREVAQILETVRAEPDGAALIEPVKSGDWNVGAAKKEFMHRGVEWNPVRRFELVQGTEHGALKDHAPDPCSVRRDFRNGSHGRA